MGYEPDPLCWCGHRRSMHTHFHRGGRPTYCGHCGINGDESCGHFTPRTQRPFNDAQRRAGEAADRRMLLNLIALSEFAVSTRHPVPPLPIPAQRRPLRSVAEQAAQHIRRKPR